MSLQQSSARPGRARRGFTLIELLVVIAVIAIIISIILPAISAARATGASLKCRANLRQWSTAMIVYAQANEGFLPRRGQGVQPTTNFTRPDDWFNSLPPLIGLTPYALVANAPAAKQMAEDSLWMCPRAQRLGMTQPFFAYGMNMWLSTSQAELPDKIDAVAPTDSQVAFADAPGAFCATLPSSKPYSAIARHRGQINIAFLDSHIGSFNGTYVGCGIGDPLRPDVRWVVPGSTWSGPGD